ncbi:MAG: phospholipase [Bacteroidales bacterium]|nr:phospholipase [Bacteroidales bacterium]
MIILFLSIVLLGIFSFFLGKRYKEKQETKNQDIPAEEEECCGQHSICEKDSLLAAVSKEIEYYDDEELDLFKQKDSDTYSEPEIEQFRDILYSLKEDEVAGWLRSLQLREIPLPTSLREEALMIVRERRIH